MKLYYIEDTMFETTILASEIRTRFEQRLLEEEKALVLVSSTHTRTEMLQEWKLCLSDEYTVLESPALFEYEEIKGNLHHTFLAIEGYPVLEAFHGTCVEIDTNRKTRDRIYLDLFPGHSSITEFDLLMDHLEDVLSEKSK